MIDYFWYTALILSIFFALKLAFSFTMWYLYEFTEWGRIEKLKDKLQGQKTVFLKNFTLYIVILIVCIVYLITA